MPRGLIRTINEFITLFGQEGGGLIARWLMFIVNHYEHIDVEVPYAYEDHWLVEIAESIPTEFEAYHDWYYNTPWDKEDYHPRKNDETLAEIQPLGNQAFLLFTTLSGEPWFPCKIVAYLYAISDQRGDDAYPLRTAMELEGINETLDLYGRRGLFRIVINP